MIVTNRFYEAASEWNTKRPAPELAKTAEQWMISRRSSARCRSYAGHMQFRQLRYFVKIVDAGSFSRAASIVHVAQPALSQQIAELEERLGVMLLQRSARGVRPTAAGEILYREASAILKQLEQLPGIVRSSDGVAQGTVCVGLASLLGPALVGG